MAAIVQPDPYQLLSRKIGYSVGLEYLARNTKELVSIYASHRKITYSDWRALVENVFKRGGNSHFHIANFFSSINLIKIIGNELYVQYGLDALSILYRLLEHDMALYDKAQAVVLSQLILEADGDIFINALASSFEREATRQNIAGMIDCKWNKLKSAFSNPAIQDKVWDLVSIRSSSSNLGAQAAGKSGEQRSPFARRTTPLVAELSRPTSIRPAKTVDVPDSYLDKVLPTRKGWAQDLGYFEDTKRTEAGDRLLDELAALGLQDNNKAFAFWPYARELAQLQLNPMTIGCLSLDSWPIVQAVVKAKSGALSAEKELDDDLLGLLREVFELYRSGSEDKGSIRHQLPIYIVKPVVAGLSCSTDRPLPDIPEIISSEITGVRRRFDFVNIRSTEGALVFRVTHK